MEQTCKTLQRDMLDDPVDIAVSGEVDLAAAMETAWARARELMKDPMMVAWYDRDGARFSPAVQCCDEHEPAWLVYAKSRGAGLTISINAEQYVFLFRDFEES